MMTIREAMQQVAEIKKLAAEDDYEAAHEAEDNLASDVLQHIADGGDHAKELAAIALLTREIDFKRYCA